MKIKPFITFSWTEFLEDVVTFIYLCVTLYKTKSVNNFMLYEMLIVSSFFYLNRQKDFKKNYKLENFGAILGC